MSKHSKLAKELYNKGYNCSQAVFAAFCDETGLDFDTAIKIASSFGGGMGRLREVCGAVSGMFMAAGLKYGYSNPSDNLSKSKHYKLIQYLAEKFKEENGSIVCRELLFPAANKDNTDTLAVTTVKKRKRPCAELVEQAAELLDQYIEEKNQGLR
jgi:C_GCAxxG_C_C family probable redox protein